jgi:hypothetical protein
MAGLSHGSSPRRIADSKRSTGLANVQELRKGTGKVSIEEILAWHHEGHKY